MEIGVLRALGAGRKTLAAQFVVEVLVIATIALVAGGLVGALVSQGIADRILDLQIEAQQDQASPGIGGATRIGRAFRFPGFLSSSLSGVSAIDEVSAAAGPMQVLQLFLACLGVSLAGSLASVAWIMKVEPMAILSDRT